MTRKLFYIYIFFVGAILVFKSSFAYATSVEFYSSVSSTSVGNILRVQVVLNPEGQNINAVEGRIIFPSNLFRLTRVETGNSIVSAWIVPPHLLDKDAVEWGGIFAGGFSGVQDPYRTGLMSGGLFTLIFEAVQQGTGTVYTEKAKVFLNDGEGTAVFLSSRSLSLRVGSRDYTLALPTENVAVDKNPPENFIPQINREETIAGGKWFVTFHTKDAESGVASYAIAEFPRRMQRIGEKSWNSATNPAILSDQALQSYVYIRAVDFAGNERVVELSPKNGGGQKTSSPLAWWGMGAFLLISIGVWGLWRYYNVQKVS